MFYILIFFQILHIYMLYVIANCGRAGSISNVSSPEASCYFDNDDASNAAMNPIALLFRFYVLTK